MRNESAPAPAPQVPAAPSPVDSSLLSGLEEEIRRARKEAIDANARASAVDRKLAEPSPLEPRVAALESDLAAIRKQVAQSANRLREEVRRELEKIEAERRRLAEELETTRQALEAANQDKVALVEKAAALQEQVERTGAQTSESVRRIESMERELSEAKSMASEAAAIRKSSDFQRAEMEKLESLRKEQDEELKSSRERIAELEETAAAPTPKIDDEMFPETKRSVEAEEVVVAAEPPPKEAPPTLESGGSVFDSEPVREVPAVEPDAAPSAPEPEGSVFDPEPVSEEAVAEPEAVSSVPTGDGASEAAKAALDPKNIFGPDGEDGRPSYVLLEQISEDGLGAVHRAYERAGGGNFAVRFLPAQADEEATAAVEESVQRLVGVPHPNILPVLGSGRKEGSVYVEMDLVAAEPLGQIQIREIPRICMIFRDVADAVHYMNEDGVVHAAVSPDSILLGMEEGGDHAYVRDFGLGHLLETLHALPGAKLPSLTLRNPAYLSPEQMKEMRRTLESSADVYGLGATFYFALSGRPPFEGKDVRQVRSRVMMEEPPPLETIRRDVPAALAVVVRRAMAKEPKLRYASARQFSEALTGFLEGRGTKILSRPAPTE